MNRVHKVKTLLAVRLGDILYDEHRRLVMLCRSCNGHYITFETYKQHLDDCPGIKHILTPTDQLSYDEAKRETRLVKGCQKVLHIYDIESVKNLINISDNYDWQAELEDPRWYTDEQHQEPQTKTKPKENGNHKRALEVKEQKEETPNVSDKPIKRLPTSPPVCPIPSATQQKRARRSTSFTTTSKTKRKDVIIVPNLKEDLQRLAKSNEVNSTPAAKQTLQKRSILVAAATAPASTVSLKPTPVPKSTPIPKFVPASTHTPVGKFAPEFSSTPAPKVTVPSDGTQQILNKLRACGVQVKRGNTQLNSGPSKDGKSRVVNQQTLDIMRKLQSKGIKCTKVKKH